MKTQLAAALLVLLSGVAGAAGPPTTPEATTAARMPPGAGEAGTLSDGATGLPTASVRPGDIVDSSHVVTVRQPAPAWPVAQPHASDPALKLMGGPGPMRGVLIAPPGAP